MNSNTKHHTNNIAMKKIEKRMTDDDQTQDTIQTKNCHNIQKKQQQQQQRQQIE